jgi:hypothetical protein
VIAQLHKPVKDLVTLNAAFSRGELSSVAHADARGDALCKAVVALAADYGVELEPIHAMDSRGELYLVAKNGSSFGEAFSTVLNRHGRPRTGALPGATLSTQASWCYLNHFDAESLVLKLTARGG